MKTNDQKYAAKIFDKREFLESNLEQLRKELKILKQIQEPGFCQLHSLLEDEKRIYLIYELCQGGSLF